MPEDDFSCFDPNQPCRLDGLEGFGQLEVLGSSPDCPGIGLRCGEQQTEARRRG
jgi:hypothetical protein